MIRGQEIECGIQDRRDISWVSASRMREIARQMPDMGQRAPGVKHNMQDIMRGTPDSGYKPRKTVQDTGCELQMQDVGYVTADRYATRATWQVGYW